MVVIKLLKDKTVMYENFSKAHKRYSDFYDFAVAERYFNARKNYQSLGSSLDFSCAYQPQILSWLESFRGQQLNLSTARLESISELLLSTENCPKAWRRLGWVYLEEEYVGNENRLLSRDAFAHAVAADPTDWLSFRDLGEAYLINRDHPAAYACLDTAVALNPHDPEPLARYALAAVRLRKASKAKAKALKAIEMAKKYCTSARVYDSAGMVFLLLGEFDLAGECLETAVNLEYYNSYFVSHLEWYNREYSSYLERKEKGQKYTPLYIRQKAKLRYFDDRNDPVPEASVAKWLADARKAVADRKDIPRYRISREPSDTLSSQLWAVRQNLSQRCCGAQWHRIMAHPKLDLHWEEFVESVFRVNMKERSLFFLLNELRNAPFKPELLVEVAKLFKKRGNYPLAFVFLVRAFGSGACEENELSDLLGKVDLNFQLGTDDAFRQNGTFGAGIADKIPEVCRHRSGKIADNDSVDTERRGIFGVAGGILLSNKEQRQVNLGAVRGSLCKVFRLLELMGRTPSELLCCEDSQSKELGAAISLLTGLEQKKYQRSALSRNSLVVSFDALQLPVLPPGTLSFSYSLDKEIFREQSPLFIGTLAVGSLKVSRQYNRAGNLAKAIAAAAIDPEEFSDLDCLEFIAQQVPRNFELSNYLPSSGGVASRLNPAGLPERPAEPSGENLLCLARESTRSTFEEVLTQLTQVKQQYPLSAAASLALSELFYESDMLQKAFEHADCTLQLDSKSERALELRANSLFLVNDFSAAATDFEKLKDMSQEFSNNNLHRLGACYLRLRKGEEAEPIYAALKNLHYTDPYFYTDYAELLLYKGEVENAENLLREGIAACGDHAALYRSLSYVYQRYRTLEEFFDFLQSAVKVCQESTLFAELARVHFISTRYEEALKACIEALKLDPTYGLAYYRLGHIYGALDEYPEAIKAYQNAAKHGYNSSNCLACTAKIRTKAGDLEGAFKDIRQARIDDTEPYLWGVEQRILQKKIALEADLSGVDPQLRSKVSLTFVFKASDREDLIEKVEACGVSVISANQLRWKDQLFFFSVEEQESSSEGIKGLFSYARFYSLTVWSYHQSSEIIEIFLTLALVLCKGSCVKVINSLTGREISDQQMVVAFSQPNFERYLIFVGVLSQPNRVQSIGMAQFGLPDVTVHDTSPDKGFANVAFVEFCLLHITKRPEFRDLDTVTVAPGHPRGIQQMIYTVDSNWTEEMPFFNKYGHYTLVDPNNPGVYLGNPDTRKTFSLLAHPDPIARLVAIQSLQDVYLTFTIPPLGIYISWLLMDPNREVQQAMFARFEKASSKAFFKYADSLLRPLYGDDVENINAAHRVIKSLPYKDLLRALELIREESIKHPLAHRLVADLKPGAKQKRSEQHQSR